MRHIERLDHKRLLERRQEPLDLLVGDANSHLTRQAAQPIRPIALGVANRIQRPEMKIGVKDKYVGMLNEVGFAQRYRSFRLNGLPCEMRIGIANQSLDRFLPSLRQAFAVEPIDAAHQ